MFILRYLLYLQEYRASNTVWPVLFYVGTGLWVGFVGGILSPLLGMGNYGECALALLIALLVSVIFVLLIILFDGFGPVDTFNSNFAKAWNFPMYRSTVQSVVLDGDCDVMLSDKPITTPVNARGRLIRFDAETRTVSKDLYRKYLRYDLGHLESVAVTTVLGTNEKIKELAF